MQLLNRAFGKKADVQPVSPGRDANYEKYLQKEFGIQCGETGWSFYGTEIDAQQALDWSDPVLLLAAIKFVQENVHFTKVCIILSEKQRLSVFNTKPKPLAFVRDMSTEQAASLIAEVLKTGRNTGTEYRGMWVLTLS